MIGDRVPAVEVLKIGRAPAEAGLVRAAGILYDPARG
jgi:hypothetical protein